MAILIVPKETAVFETAKMKTLKVVKTLQPSSGRIPSHINTYVIPLLLIFFDNSSSVSQKC